MVVAALIQAVPSQGYLIVECRFKAAGYAFISDIGVQRWGSLVMLRRTCDEGHMSLSDLSRVAVCARNIVGRQRSSISSERNSGIDFSKISWNT